jgi:hypothetical protein
MRKFKMIGSENMKVEIKNEINEDEETKLIREENGKYIPIAFALIVSIIAILFDTNNLVASIYPNQPSLNGAMIAVAFLVAWIFFGAFMGYTKKKSFIKSISLYWGIGCSLYLIGEWAGSTKSFSLLKTLMLPFYILFLTPTYGLGYYYKDISFLYQPSIIFPYQYALSSILISLLSGALGYLLGYLLKKIKG